MIENHGQVKFADLEPGRWFRYRGVLLLKLFVLGEDSDDFGTAFDPAVRQCCLIPDQGIMVELPSQVPELEEGFDWST
jgi:hypothetical protein